MKKSFTILAFFAMTTLTFAQSETDKTAVAKACMNYIEGFYEGDTTKIIDCLKPTLHKYGFWKDKNSGKYEGDGYMTFKEAKKYARNVLAKEKSAKSDAPKEVEVLDIMNHIAAAKVTAWWGTDYMLLSKVGDKWMIEQVLWEGLIF